MSTSILPNTPDNKRIHVYPPELRPWAALLIVVCRVSEPVHGRCDALVKLPHCLRNHRLVEIHPGNAYIWQDKVENLVCEGNHRLVEIHPGNAYIRQEVENLVCEGNQRLVEVHPGNAYVRQDQWKIWCVNK